VSSNGALDKTNLLLRDIAPTLEDLLSFSSGSESLRNDRSEAGGPQTCMVKMRDGIQLATDIHFSLSGTTSAPTVVLRTPYGRRAEKSATLARRFCALGYVVVVQDCRGTGDSEPDAWDYYIFEPEDSFDLIEWITAQTWFNGCVFGTGGSYASATQWCMAAHPRMTAIAPEMTGLQTIATTVKPHLFVNGYPRAVGKGSVRQSIAPTEIEAAIHNETMSSGFFNRPLVTHLPEAILARFSDLACMSLPEARRELWARISKEPPAARAMLIKALMGVDEFTYVDLCSLANVFDDVVPYGVHTIPSSDERSLCERIEAPALVITGWYDWGLDDVLPSWAHLRRWARPRSAEGSRLIITPSAHHLPGYREGLSEHRELQSSHRNNVALLHRWFESVRADGASSWPRVIYYLMGANEWRVASDWPPPTVGPVLYYLHGDGGLARSAPNGDCAWSEFVYDPLNPTPTVGGSLVSYLYPVGSVDVAPVQDRDDVICFTSSLLDEDVDVVGPIKMRLFASSSAADTDFVVRLSDVFPDGRAVQLQNGVLRTRYRNAGETPTALTSDRTYELEIDMWATANRFKAGHRIRVDISSADFPRLERNSNLAGALGKPVAARQRIYHDQERASHIVLPVLPVDPGRCTDA